MIRAYGDESMDETKQRVCAVALVTGEEKDWPEVESKWVARTGGMEFHAKDCDTNPGRGNHANNSHDENKALYRDLTTILAESNLFGFGVAIDLAAQREVFPYATHFTYFRALMEVIELTRQHAEYRSDMAEITFDTRIETDHNAGLLYAQYREDVPGWKENLASKVSFETSNCPRIQMADLLARETMKWLDNFVGPVKRLERKSWAALRETRRFAISDYGKGFFQELKRSIPALNKHLGFGNDDYQRWLKERRLQHNTTNSFKFLDEMTRGRIFPSLEDLSKH